ncbi:MAG: hypothetical protein AAFX41_11245 [Bacteroidota bacterium]
MYAETLEAGRVPDRRRPEYLGVIARESERLSRLSGTRPASSVSAYIRMSASGVRSSCDTFDTSRARTRASSISCSTLR